MKLKDYEELPDGISNIKLEEVIEVFFMELKGDSKKTACEKLDVISDYQWHTYELPSQRIRVKVENFLLENWEDSSEYAEFAMGIIYCFGLSKSLFEKAFINYKDKNDPEFLDMLSNSSGKNIDPYWSLH